MTVSRNDLHQEIWAEPMTTVARRYEVASNYLKRVCDALAIPCPPRGYWAKVAAGQDPAVPRLLPAHPGLPAAWTKGDTVAGQLPVRKSDVAERNAAEPGSRPLHHPLLRAVAELHEGGRGTHTDYLRPAKRVLPDIVVSELERRRAEAVNASREELLAIVDRWALARRVADFFGDAEARAARLDDEQRNRVMTRLEVAREMLGGTDALRQFAGWRSPVERESTP